jgi:hypothetical protein
MPLPTAFAAAPLVPDVLGPDEDDLLGAFAPPITGG